jgi:adenylate cyclase
MKIPISAQLITITAGLLVCVTVPIAFKSSEEFEKNSVQRENAINRELAESRAKQLENIIMNLTEKTTSSARLLLKATTQSDATNASTDFDINFNNDNDFVAIEVYKIDGTSIQSVAQKIKSEALKPYGLTNLYITQLRNETKFPIRSIVEDNKGKVILVNSSGPEKKTPPMITIGVPLVRDAQNKITHVALADVNLSVLQKPFGKRSASTFFVADSNGILLAHSDEKLAIAKKNMSALDIVQFTFKSPTPSSTKLYQDPETHKNFLGAYAKTSFGVTVFSQIEEEKVLAPSQKVKLEAFKIAGYFLSAALLLVFLFSMMMTSPIEKLVQLIGVVSKGNFDVKATKEIKFFMKDEVHELSAAFDNMTEGLKERDKVKSLFNKFHGSSVTDDLMQNDIGLGGQNKDVVVFFSDIRGFTAFSENKSPEEVVQMLNEYFAVMVGIINKHGGVVDKFIGDAIMAVWGAPKTSDKDPQNAVRACLEMRKALAVLNEKRIARGDVPIQIGMGLHAGQAISGTIGSDERMEYTVIGNTVNTGSRIEASTKAFGSDMLISESVYEKVADLFMIEYAGAAEVKGRTDALKMFKVRGYKDEKGEFVEVKTPYSDYEAGHVDKVKIAS